MAKTAIKTRRFERYVGKIASMELEGMEFEVVIKGYKNTYGRNRFLVQPRNGRGEKWSENVRIAGVKTA